MNPSREAATEVDAKNGYHLCRRFRAGVSCVIPSWGVARRLIYWAPLGHAEFVVCGRFVNRGGSTGCSAGALFAGSVGLANGGLGPVPKLSRTGPIGRGHFDAASK